MINSVKALRQIDIESKFAFQFDDIPYYLQDRLFGISVRPKAKAVSREEWGKQWREYLSNSLLYHAVNNVGDPQFAFTAIGFIDLHAPGC